MSVDATQETIETASSSDETPVRQIFRQHSLRLSMDGALHEVVAEEDHKVDDEDEVDLCRQRSISSRPLHVTISSNTKQVKRANQKEVHKHDVIENVTDVQNATSQPDYGYESAQPDSSQANYYGYGDEINAYHDYSDTSSVISSESWDSQHVPRRRPQRRSSVTSYNLEQDLAKVQNETDGRNRQAPSVHPAYMATCGKGLCSLPPGVSPVPEEGRKKLSRQKSKSRLQKFKQLLTPSGKGSKLLRSMQNFTKTSKKKKHYTVPNMPEL